RSTPSSFSEADSVSSETGRVLGDCSARCIPLRPIAAASSLPRGLLTRTPTIGSTPSGTCHEDAWAGSSESVFGIDRVLQALAGLPHGLAGTVPKVCRRHRLGTSAPQRWPSRTL